jgi:hypothetical protein
LFHSFLSFDHTEPGKIQSVNRTWAGLWLPHVSRLIFDAVPLGRFLAKVSLNLKNAPGCVQAVIRTNVKKVALTGFQAVDKCFHCPAMNRIEIGLKIPQKR